MKKKLLFALVLLIVCSFTLNVYAQGTSKKENEKWFKKQEWLGGLKLQPHSSIDAQEFAKLYKSHKKYFDEAFAFLKSHDLTKLATGKYPIDGDNVYASVTYDPTKDFDKSKWESHRKYTDLQYVISGGEKIGVTPVAGLTVTEAYSAEKDIAHYNGPGKIYDAKPGTFFLFFPGTAHRPNITTGGNKPDKKIVIKIKSD
ncbi:MAG: YhcH/YjgK/YiaL family protein [Bacteroidota bacterium]|nr:YhcH/YjgK/YiaL family protein [Bacteroidota bacterium]